MTETDEHCHWNGEQRVTARHLRDCEASGCEGCQPCSRDHCTMPRCSHHLREHERLVCDSCVGKVREALTRLVQLCGFAPAVAVTSGIHSQVAVLTGPIAELSTYRARHDWAVYSRGLCRCQFCPDLTVEPEGPECKDWQTCEHYACRRRTGRPTCPGLVEWLELVDDERHPLWVLEGWDRLVAEHFGHTRSLRVTVKTAASYLDSNLTDLARLDDFAFDELAREVADCVTHVEGVLLLLARVQRGVPCPVCGKANLEKHWEPTEGELYDPANDAHMSELGRWDDLWVCPNAGCGQTWTEAEYREKVDGIYVQKATHLTASQIASTYRVPEGSVRGWAAKGKVRKRGKSQTGLTLYDVQDTLAMRDKTNVGR